MFNPAHIFLSVLSGCVLSVAEATGQDAEYPREDEKQKRISIGPEIGIMVATDIKNDPPFNDNLSARYGAGVKMGLDLSDNVTIHLSPAYYFGGYNREVYSPDNTVYGTYRHVVSNVQIPLTARFNIAGHDKLSYFIVAGGSEAFVFNETKHNRNAMKLLQKDVLMNKFWEPSLVIASGIASALVNGKHLYFQLLYDYSRYWGNSYGLSFGVTL